MTIKNLPIKLSLLGNFLLAAALIFVLFVKKEAPIPTQQYTEQDLSKSIQIEQGMKKESVVALLGNPIIKDIYKSKEEWHYCHTGDIVDEFVVITFNGSTVDTLLNYTVSWLDVLFKYTKTPTEAMLSSSRSGDCKLMAKWGNYSQLDSKAP